IAQVEALCETLYNASDEAQRSHAQSQLLSLQSSGEYIPQCQYILDNSKNNFALHLASNSLTRLITLHWNNFTVSQRVDIRSYILAYLASNGPQLTDYVVTSLIQLLCRITKLGWFDDIAHRDLVDEVLKFLQATNDHYVIGLKILNQLVEELNLPISGRTLPQHRKTAVSFRDLCLFKVFQISLTALKQLHSRLITGATPEQEASMSEHALRLCQRCLSFDFIGTNPDESAEDVGTIQVPSAWREVITDTATMSLLCDFYNTTDPPRSSLAMQSIILLSSVRRSLFAKESDRAAYLQQLMNFLRDVLQTQRGLQHQENYHEFCRQLGRLKANYQLSELLRVEGFIEWVELAANFVVKAFQNWQWSTNSIHYLLALWGRLVAAVPYVRSDMGAKAHTQHMRDCVLRVVQCYIQSMVDSVDIILASEGSIDDPLDDEGSLKEQLDRLPVICRCQYSLTAQFLLSLFDPIMAQYQEVVQLLGPHAHPDVQQRGALLEGKLIWLVYIAGAVVSGFSWSDASANEGEETIDASLCRRVFQLAQGVDYRLSSTGGQGKCSAKFEVALLSFFQTFRRMYMWEQHHLSGALGGLSGIMVGSLGKSDYEPNLKQKVFQRFFEHMGLGDHSAIINVIVTKIGNNLKYWADTEEVVGKTLQLFLDMASGYSSSKMLLGLDTVKFLIEHHTSDHFPFLAVPSNTRHRTTFHLTLARLIFSTVEGLNSVFDAFMEPLLTTLAQIAAAPNFRDEAVKVALIGVCRDLRGVTAASNNRRAYGKVFEVLYPAHFPVLVRAAEEWGESPDLAAALLKFMQEFVYNKAQRLVFDQSSPNGILLFRATSEIVCACGNRIMRVAGAEGGGDVYKRKYKGISMCLSVLTMALSGTYVNFGVFKLYNDKALDNVLQCVLQLALSVPLQDVVSFPKLTKAYFSFFEVLFRNHLQVALQLDTPVFTQIMTAVHEGLQSLEAPLASQCAATIDHLATFRFQNAEKNTPAAHALKAHLQATPNLLSSLMSTLFNILLFDSASNQTTNQCVETPPIFHEYKQKLIDSQSPENQTKLREAFAKLLSGAQRNLESTNRDR
ncbi:unnamed protein product, partial [Chrysoparadoxa australica]